MAYYQFLGLIRYHLSFRYSYPLIDFDSLLLGRCSIDPGLGLTRLWTRFFLIQKMQQHRIPAIKQDRPHLGT